MNWNEIIKNAIAGQKTLLEAAKNAVRAFTDEEQTKFDDFSKEVTNANKMLKAEKAVLDNTPATPAAPATPATPATPTEPAAPTNTGGGIPTAGQNVHIKSNPKTWENGIGSVLTAIAKSKTSGVMDPRFENAAAGGNEVVPQDGGFLVGSTMTDEILKRVYDSAQLAGRCRKRSVSVGNRWVQNYVKETSRTDGNRMGGVEAHWINEAENIPVSKPTFGQIDLKLGKLAGFYYATDELLEDSVGLESDVAVWFGDEFSYKLDDSILNGTGAGQPKGILNSNALVTVAKEAGQSADTIVYENILKMWSRAWAKGRFNSVWLINQNIEPELFSMSQTIGTAGVPVYLPANGVSGAPFRTLMGLPVIPIEQASTLGTKGDIMLMDLDSYLLIEKKGQGIKGAESIHIEFASDQKAFRFIYRVNGQPIWQSALTPAKGTATLSPFITLAARP